MASKKLQLVVELKDVNFEESKDNSIRGGRGNKNKNSNNISINGSSITTPTPSPVRNNKNIAINNVSNIKSNNDKNDDKDDIHNKYELCLVFPIDKATNDVSDEASQVIDKIIHTVGKKYTYTFTSSNGKKRMLLIRCGISRLGPFAEKIKYRLLLDPNNAKAKALEGDPVNGIDSISILHDDSITSIEPFDYIYSPYVTDPSMQSIYWRPSELSHPFRSNVRLRLLLRLIQGDKLHGGAGLHLKNLVHAGIASDFFPVHNKDLRLELNTKWLSQAWPWKQPLDEIEDYFGQKIAHSFALRGHIIIWLLVPAMAGIAFEVTTLYWKDFSRPEIVVFAVFMSAWIVFMSEEWKSREKYIFMPGGMFDENTDAIDDRAVDEDDLNAVRSTFQGTQRISHVSGREILVEDRGRQCRGYICSMLLFMILLYFIFGSTIAVYVVRYLITNHDGWAYRNAQWVTSGINAIIIELFNRGFNVILAKLTELENHRTDVSFESSYITKLFVFQFVNYFSSFYFLAFVAVWFPDYWVQCLYTTCMAPLAINLIAILGFKVFIKALFGYMLPIARVRLHRVYRLCATKDIYGARNENCCVPAVPVKRGSVIQHLHSPGTLDLSVDTRCKFRYCSRVAYDWCGVTLCEDKENDDDDEEKNRKDKSEESQKRKAIKCGLCKRINYSCHSLFCDNSMSRDEYEEDCNRQCPCYDDDPENQCCRNKCKGACCRGDCISCGKLLSLLGCYRARPKSKPFDCTPFKLCFYNFFTNFCGQVALDEDAIGEYLTADGDGKSVVELEYSKIAVDGAKYKSLQVYIDEVMMVGLCTIFVTALPAAPALLLVFSWMFTRFDAWKYINLYRRPIPLHEYSVRQWHEIFRLMSILVTLTNAALIPFTFSIFESWSILYKLLIFIGFQWVVFFLQYLYSLTTRVMKEVEIQNQRTAFINSKLIDKVPDGDIDPLQCL